MLPHELYDDVVDVRRSGVFTGGKEIEETASLRELLDCDIPLLVAFAGDNDIQYVQFCSTCIGFIRTYQKRYRAKQADGRA